MPDSLRTITLWAIYDPKRKRLVTTRRFKYEIESLVPLDGDVVVQLKGHYTAKRKEKA